MIYFSYSTFKALVSTLWILYVIGPSTSNIIKGQLPSLPVLANFVRFIKPFIQADKNNLVLRTDKSASQSFITNVIQEKIKELKPYLQDDDDVSKTNIRERLEDEETAIIEFIPGPRTAKGTNDIDKDYIRKYKRLKKKIDKMLRKEPISDKTKKLVSSTFDDMLGQVMGNQCSWKSVDDPNVNKSLRTGKMLRRNAPFTFASLWNRMWNKVNEQIKAKPENDVTQKLFLNHFQEFVSNILKDTEAITDHYTVVCQVLDDDVKYKSSKNKNPLRNSKIEHCPNFKVCSDELRDFLVDFYINLNETAVSTIQNYAAMFARDVKEDTRNEKKTVIAIINKTCDALEHKINLIFKKKTDKFQLDKNKDKNANLKAINHYIYKTINHVKKQVNNDLTSKLSNLRSKLRVNIQKDIDVNLEVDLGNLEKELTSKVCMVFEGCNGKVAARRQNDDANSIKVDKNSIYVKVQLSLDDKKLKRADRRIAVGVGQAMKSVENDLLNVTRTTIDISKIRPTLTVSSRFTAGDIQENLIEN